MFNISFEHLFFPMGKPEVHRTFAAKFIDHAERK